jgi:signal transduction histidine kinase
LLQTVESSQYFREYASEFSKHIEQARKEHRNISFEIHIKTDDFGKYYTVDFSPIYTRQIYICTIILFKDITQSKKDLETIKRNHEMLMEQERLASLGQLIGGIAHNLRTPIMSIAGGIEGIRDLVVEYRESIGDTEVTEDDHREIADEIEMWLDRMKPHCTYMSDVISAVKGQAIQYDGSELLSFTIDELCKRIEILMKHELRKYHCNLILDIQVDKYLELRGEINMLIQVFDNIIINAIQAYEGKRGDIKLTIKKQKNWLVFSFEDKAGGIKPDIQGKLFKEMTTTKGKNGTGLGLFMSYSTIRGRFGGDIWFETEYGKGTTFFVSIPGKFSHDEQEVS